MAHETTYAANFNGFIRQVRSFLMDSPRVVRANDHDDINNLGVAYELAAAAGARPAGDILHVASEAIAPLTTYRATSVVGSASGGSYQSQIANTVTFNIGARTIVDDGGGDWSTAGVVAGDLIRIYNSATAGNDGIWRVLTITTGSSTNDTLTLDTNDTLAASDAADAILVYPITGGSVFDVVEDHGGGANHIGWMMSEIEFMAKDGSIWLFMRDGGSWAVGDYAEFDLEAGPMTLHDNLIVSRTVDLNENGASADTITRTDYNGNFLRDGFIDGGIVTIAGSAGEDGDYAITTVTAKTMTLAIGAFTADELGVDVELTPRLEAVATFATPANTLTRVTGSWIDDGFLPGGQIEIANAVDLGNNGRFLVDTVTALVLTVDSGETIAAETSDTITVTPRNSILNKWSEHRYIWGSASASPSNSNTLDSGELPPRPDADGNYTSEWIGIGPGDDPVNNLQTIYCGWQTQFSGASVQNVEQRCFDAVSDSAFNSLGNASPPTYIYLNLTPSMELFMTGDGAHITGFADVNTSVTEWFYLGFANIHGSQSQHPRPMINGGISSQANGSRASSGNNYHFFPSGVSKSDTTSAVVYPPNSSCWHRWVDGQWFSVANIQVDNVDNLEGRNQSLYNMWTWPYKQNTDVITFPFNDGADDFQGIAGTGNANPNGRNAFPRMVRSTPTSITPNPNREHPLLPIVGMMTNPSYNIVFDFRNVYFVPGDGQATKNRIFQNGYTYMVGQNHDKTGQQNFAALRLN